MEQLLKKRHSKKKDRLDRKTTLGFRGGVLARGK